jgi:hypothetical protein
MFKIVTDTAPFRRKRLKRAVLNLQWCKIKYLFYI